MVNLLGYAGSGDEAGLSLTEDARRTLAVRELDVARWWSIRQALDLPLSRALRTPALEPDIEEMVSLPALEGALALLSERRSALLREAAPAEAAVGRLLLCEFNMSIGTGESEIRSQGFFDEMDRPPWDTWLVAFGRTRRTQPDQPIECLISWVPDAWLERVDDGIRANRCDCLHWVDEEREAADSVRRSG